MIAIDAPAIAEALNRDGHAIMAVLDAATCRALAGLYDDDTRFRRRVVMQQHNYGRGEYKYLAYPLPDPVAALRTALYPALARVANDWRKALGETALFPETLDAYLSQCHTAG